MQHGKADTNKFGCNVCDEEFRYAKYLQSPSALKIIPVVLEDLSDASIQPEAESTRTSTFISNVRDVALIGVHPLEEPLDQGAKFLPT